MFCFRRTFEVSCVRRAIWELHKGHKRPPNTTDVYPLNGLLICPDCNEKLTVARKSDYQYYNCSTYRHASKFFKTECARHSISKVAIEAIVLKKIQDAVTFAKTDKDAFAAKIYSATNKDTEKAVRAKQAEIRKAENRLKDLDKLIKGTLEKQILLNISDERIGKVIADYEKEEIEVTAKLAALNGELESSMIFGPLCATLLNSLDYIYCDKFVLTE